MTSYLLRPLQRIAAVQNVILGEKHRLVRVVVELHLLLVVNEAIPERVGLSNSLWRSLVPERVLKFGDEKRRWNARRRGRERASGCGGCERCRLLSRGFVVGSNLNGG